MNARIQNLRLAGTRRSRRPYSPYTVLRYVPPLAVVAFGVAAWQFATVLLKVPSFLLPGPLAIWQSALQERTVLLVNTWPTLEEALVGFILAVLLGLGLTLAIRYSRLLELSLYPLLIGSQSVPLIALAPILVVLLGYNLLPKLVMVVLVSFFPIVVNGVDGFKSVDPGRVNLLRSLGARKLQILRELEFPSALPFIFSGAKIAAAYSVVGAIVGEWAGSWEGLGFLIIQKNSEFDISVIFAALVILTVMGLAMFGAVAVAERLLMPWHRIEKGSGEGT